MKYVNNTGKSPYVAPLLHCTIIYSENCIAANSAKVTPTDINDSVKEQWIIGDDVVEEIDW